MTHPAKSFERRRVRERVSGTHRDYEIFLVKDPRGKPRRNIVQGKNRDVDRARFQVGEGVLPGAPAGLPSSAGRICRTPMSMVGGRRAQGGKEGRQEHGRDSVGRADEKRRVDLAASKGAAVETMRLTRARMSAIGSARSVARAVGTTPRGVLRNSGSLRSRRSRPRPWLTAEGERFSRSAARPTWRSSSTSWKRTRRLRSARDRSIWFSISVKSYHWLHHPQNAISNVGTGRPAIPGSRTNPNTGDLACHTSLDTVLVHGTSSGPTAGGPSSACRGRLPSSLSGRAGPELWFAKDAEFDRRFPRALPASVRGGGARRTRGLGGRPPARWR